MIAKLTKTEEQIMQIIWQLEKALVKDIIARLPEKKPHQTVSSVVRLLEQKGFVGHKSYGRTHEYFPVVTKAAYRKLVFKNMLTDYFDGSYKQVVSFFVHEKEMDKADLEELLRDLEE